MSAHLQEAEIVVSLKAMEKGDKHQHDGSLSLNTDFQYLNTDSWD